ncbi:class I SAM-dependent methyltransferase [Lentisphaerota bacterium ZTH]|nr:methyltransferase domain-containing protein [Lentisphaerota bacterium]WET07681.1 class I SAM-dependent methyltransferase [Lentisphaerota bacterium ZTH]
MEIQNIYDNLAFFSEYKKLRDNARGFNNEIEQPAVRSLVENMKDKKVLDIGCGFGNFCRYAADQGALSVLGIDPSKNMIREAASTTLSSNIQYLCLPVETFSTNLASFDIIVSSLAFHYVKEFDSLVQNIEKWLKKSGQLVFSVEHPICTAWPEGSLKKDNAGKSFHPVYNYRDEGQFEQTWFVDGVRKYHRKLSTYINTLLEHGFAVERVLEPMPSDEQIAQYPKLKIHRVRPPLLIISAKKR